MTLQQIKEAVDRGETVYWSSHLYKVIKDDNDYYIKAPSMLIGLTWADGKTLNGKEEDFYSI